MGIEKLIEKLSYYTEKKQQLEQTKESALSEIEEKVLTKRLALIEKVDAECQEYAKQLKSEFDESYAKDYEKVSNYIELLKDLIGDSDATEDTSEVEENEHNGNDN